MTFPVDEITNEDIVCFNAISELALGTIVTGITVAAGTILICQSSLQTCVSYSTKVACEATLCHFLIFGLSKAKKLYNAL